MCLALGLRRLLGQIIFDLCLDGYLISVYTRFNGKGKAQAENRRDTMRAKDQNGNALRANVRKAKDGAWGSNVWFGSNPATTLRRYFYETRDQARGADIGDEPGKRGCIRFGEYE